MFEVETFARFFSKTNLKSHMFMFDIPTAMSEYVRTVLILIWILNHAYIYVHSLLEHILEALRTTLVQQYFLHGSSVTLLMLLLLPQQMYPQPLIAEFGITWPWYLAVPAGLHRGTGTWLAIEVVWNKIRSRLIDFPSKKTTAHFFGNIVTWK